MSNVILLMKLDIIFHVKTIWKMKWQFLLFFFIFVISLFIAIYQPTKLFRVSYFNEDDSYESKVAIDNFIDGLQQIAEIKEVEGISQVMGWDAFIYFPKGFADKWQHFEAFPVKIYILTQNPIYQSLLTESFKAYENILLSSEAIIKVYNQELNQLNLDSQQWKMENISISLDFLNLAFHRNKLFLKKELDTLPAALTSSYYYVSFALFFGILICIFRSSLEIERRKYYQRIFLTKITKLQFMISNLFSIIINSIIVVMLLVIIRFNLHIDINYEFYIYYILVLITIYLAVQFISYGCKHSVIFSMIAITLLFIVALLGGAFLPISFLPNSWMPIVIQSPFYQLFLFMTKQGVEDGTLGFTWLWILASILLSLGNIWLLRRVRYE